MKRAIVAVLGFLVLPGGSVSAHHGYANYVTEHRVYVEGTVEDIVFKNPHVLMQLKTVDGTNYMVMWQGASWLAHIGVTKETFKVGDHLVVFGAPNRNPALHDMQSLREVRRLSDGWDWKADY